MTEKKKINIKDENDMKDEAYRENGDDSQNEPNTEMDKTDDIEEKLMAAEEEAKQFYDRFLRVSAEFENYKKRSSREISEFKKFANESLITALLPVIDNLERAVCSSKENNCDIDSLREGIDLTLNEIVKVLEKFDVKPIEALGKEFDPNFHQAMMQEASLDHPDNTILQELQKGYMIHNRLLRPSMVVVSKQTEKEEDILE